MNGDQTWLIRFPLSDFSTFAVDVSLRGAEHRRSALLGNGSDIEGGGQRRPRKYSRWHIFDILRY